MITKDMEIGRVIREHPETIPVFLESGLRCIACPLASQETIEQGAGAHGIPIKELLSRLNASVSKQ